MRNIEIVLKLLVPILFLVVWALNQVLSRDAKQAPGPIARKPPVPPPGGGWGGPASMERRLGPNTGRDEVVILPGERRPASPQPSFAPTPQKAPGPNPFEATAARGGAGQTARARKNRRQAATTSTPAPSAEPSRRVGAAVRPTGGMSAATATGIAASGPGSLLDTDQTVIRIAKPNEALIALKAAMSTPRDMRQALILAEVLRPPVSMRRRLPR
jgi:hypothetical protein